MEDDVSNRYYELTSEWHRATFGLETGLLGLKENWQRELASIWRMCADIPNGGYIQFIGNWKRVSYVYGSQSLGFIGALQMKGFVDQAQNVIDKYPERDGWGYSEIYDALSENDYSVVMGLSERFWNFPDPIPDLIVKYYGNRELP